jgi:hypothetical protein
MGEGMLVKATVSVELCVVIDERNALDDIRKAAIEDLTELGYAAGSLEMRIERIRDASQIPEGWEDVHPHDLTPDGGALKTVAQMLAEE